MKRRVLPVLSLFFILFVAGCKKEASGSAVKKEIQMFNFGVPGNTSADLIGRAKDVINYNPDLVIIMIGTNDAKSATDKFASYETNMAYLIKMFKTTADVLLVKPPPILYNDDGNNRLNLLCRQIDTLSARHGCFMVDVNGRFKQIMAGGTGLIGPDGLHPYNKGQKIIAQTIYDFIIAGNIKKKKIACLGDSITHGTNAGVSYPDYLAGFLNN